MICEPCGQEFEPKWTGQRYHNNECRLIDFAKQNQDREHQTKAGKRAGAARGAQLTAKAQKSGYRGYVKTSNDRHEHRVVASKTLGRPLAPGEVVHHEDLDKTNNDPANLFVFPTQAMHARHHKLGHPGKPMCDCAVIRLREVMPK
jgi:hypothetical protein